MLLLLALACTEPADTGAEELPAASLLDGYESVVVLSWSQEDELPGLLEFRADGGPWQRAPARRFTAGANSQLLLGVPYDAEVEWRLIREFREDAAGSIRTGPLPEDLPLPTLTVHAPGRWDSSVPYLLTSVHEHYSDWSSTWWVVILDRAGRVVWAHRSREEGAPLPWVSRHVTVSHEGDAVLVDRATAWTAFDHGEASTVVAMTLDGTVHHTWATPGLHHALTSLPGGRVGYPARDPLDHETEIIMEVDLDGHLTEVWRCEPFWHTWAPAAPSCGSNGLWWHADSDRYLLSLWSLETIVEVSRPTGEATRWFGHAQGSWGFSPEASTFWWQHGPVYTPGGSLLLVSRLTQEARETVVREYVLDEHSSTLEQIWTAGEGLGVYASYGGDATRLPSGHTLVGYGSAGRLGDLHPDGTVEWEVAWDGDRRVGQTTALRDLYALVP